MNNSGPSILGVDIGTSSLKAVVFNFKGEIEAISRVGYSYRTPAAGWAEINPETWWQSLKEALAQLRDKGIALQMVAAISFTGQMHTGVLFSADDKILQPTILWLDRRATAEMEKLQESLNLPPYQLNSTYTLPKLLWLYNNRLQVMTKAKKILWPKDFLRWRLTGEMCTDPTDAMGSGLYDWENKCWAEDRLRLVGLTPEVLPPIVPANFQGGKIIKSVAGELGLNPAVKVVVGMGDMAALIGGAPAKRGRVVCSLGTSSMVFTRLSADEVVSAPHNSLYTITIDSYRLFGGVSSTTGASLVWIYDNIFSWNKSKNQIKSFEDYVQDALEIKPGADGLCFIPYLAGERSPYWSDHLKGGFYGLQTAHDLRHLTRAVLEGVAFSLRHLLDIFEVSGVPVNELALAAGGIRTPGWAQIIADACQMDVSIYSGQETVTRVLYAICMEHLGQGKLEKYLQDSFAKPHIVKKQENYQKVYAQNYRVYRNFSKFALNENI